MEAIKLCRLDTPIIFIEARINLSRFVVTGCAAKTSATVTFPSLKDRKSGSAGMPRPISYAVFCLKKKNVHLVHHHECALCLFLVHPEPLALGHHALAPANPTDERPPPVPPLQLLLPHDQRHLPAAT